MTNSDFLIKAAIRKLSEKLNKTFNDKFEEATSTAKGVPEILKKEFDSFKNEIIEEAIRLEKESNDKENNDVSNSNINPKIIMAEEKAKELKVQLKLLNDKLDS